MESDIDVAQRLMREWVEEMKTRGYKDMHIGGLLHGATVSMAVTNGMSMEQFIETSVQLYTSFSGASEDKKN